MRFFRRRSDRPDAARRRLGSSLETLEARTLLTGSNQALFFQYTASDLNVYNPITHKPILYSVQDSLRHNPSFTNSNLINEGKIVSGKDLAGDEWTITVHGPGYVIVTDTTPNDGVLENSIDTIQLVGTDINKTYVTGSVSTSARVQTNGTIQFNRLIDTSGVNSIILNGFTLTDTVTPPGATTPRYQNTGIFLTGGVRVLEFHDILAKIDTNTNDAPINVVIGDPATPINVEPTIKLDNITNLVFNSSATTVPANTPLTDPTVNVIVNGSLHGLDLISTTQGAINPPFQFQFPIVATTGRTSVQTIGINKLTVHGAATNFTASRSSVPFQNGFTGLSHLDTATFQGPTDAVGLDVHGNIGSLKFKKGAGNPYGVFIGTTAAGPQVPATLYGIPAGSTGYAAAGFIGAQVTAKKIGSLAVLPANVVTATPSNPDFVQLRQTGYPYYVVKPGAALTNALITSEGNIGQTAIVGDLVNSEIKAGFDYNSFAAGLEGTRAPSRIGPLHQNGNSVNGVTSATVRPASHFYGTPTSIYGPGTIRGKSNGSLFNTGGLTPLDNVGAGFFARTKTGGYLPPPQTSIHKNGKLIR
jgi:hypothetical protein